MIRKFLILSDLHAYSSVKPGAPAPSLLQADSAAFRSDMIEGVNSTIKKEGLGVDCIICPGDIADKADAVAQANIWHRLASLKDELGASHLIATTGNHDIDSRLKHSDFDPKSSLQSLNPPFPGGSEIEIDKYWSRNFVIYTFDEVRIVNLNSSAFHGISSDEDDGRTAEYLRGRVSSKTSSAIKAAVQSDTRQFKYNILLTHHHVYKNDDIYENDNSEMIGAGRLLRDLQEVCDTPWLIIHGHQHYPRIEYYLGGSGSPIVFSAGSLSAQISADLSSRAPNQFYHLEIDDDANATGNWSPCGRIKAWHWVKREGWIRSPSTFNIPYECGFGCRENNITIGDQIVDVITNATLPFVTLGDLLKSVPHFKFVLPTEQKKIIDHVEKSGIIVALMSDQDPHRSTFRKA